MTNFDYDYQEIIINESWGLGIGDWGLGPIPNPQSPIPKYLISKLQTLKNNLLYIINK